MSAPAPSRASLTDSWSEPLDLAVDDCFDDMVSVRRYLHTHPEPSGQELRTIAYLNERLVEAGFDPRLASHKRGLLVDSSECGAGPSIALRADVDALKIEDAKKVDYRSQVTGVMHACGHDAHPAMLLGAIRALRVVESAGGLPWPVRWRAIFQPAEETCVGAKEMVAEGALEDIDAILALHVDPSREIGKIGTRVGPLTSITDQLNIVIVGRGGHAARPHESRDPIAAAAQLISSMYLFVPRATDSHDSVVVTIGQIIGGESANVIPETVELRGTLRTLSQRVRERTQTHIRQLARGLAESSGTKIRVEFNGGTGSVVNDAELTALVRQTGTDLLGATNVEEIDRPSMGAEDFAQYLPHVPGTMFRLGVTSQNIGGAPLHSPMFDIDERALAIGAKILARSAVSWSDPARHHNGNSHGDRRV